MKAFGLGLLVYLIRYLAFADKNDCKIKSEVVHEWVTVDFLWDNETQKQEALDSGLYIPENCSVTGVKAYGGEVFVTVPRWRQGVPSTLNKVVVVDGTPKLQPFPSWEMQRVEDPEAFQFVQSMYIDSRGWMWIIDTGRVFGSDSTTGVPQLIIYNLKNDSVIHTFDFPQDIAPPATVFLNDIAVDETNDFAYISEMGNKEKGGMIMYSLKDNKVRRWESLTMKYESIDMRIYDKDYSKTFRVPIDGIAIDNDFSTVYYCPLDGYHLYAVPTTVLRNFSSTFQDIESSVVDLGPKVAPSDGLIFSKNGKLIFGGLTTSAVYSYEPGEKLNTDNQVLLAQSDETLQWPDTFGVDEEGNLWILSNKLHEYKTNTMDYSGKSGANYRVVKINAKDIEECTD